MQRRGIIHRVIPFVLTLVITVFSLAVPAKATSVTENVFLNVLDFDTVAGTSNQAWCWAGQNFVEFSLPMTFMVTYIDITVSVYSADFIPFYEHPAFGGQRLSMTHITDNLYRIYGAVPAWGTDTLKLRFDCGSELWILFERVEILTSNVEHVFTRASGLLEAYDVFEYVYRDPTVSDPAYVTGTIPSDIDTSFIFTVTVPEWNVFDFVDIQLYALCKDITSITCFYGDVNIPIEVSFIDNGAGDSESSIYNISIRVDFTGIRRDTITDKNGEVIYPQIIVNGNLLTNHYFKFHLLQCSGFVVLNDTSTLAFFFRQLGQNLSNWFSQVTSAVNSGFQNMGNSLSSGFQSVVNQFTSSPLVTKLSDIVSAIGTGVDRIVEAIWASSSQDQEDQQDEAATQASEMDELIDQMEEVTKPSIEDIPADIEEIVDGNAVALATGGLAAIMVNPVLNPLFTLALIFSTAAYVLFGKR